MKNEHPRIGAVVRALVITSIVLFSSTSSGWAQAVISNLWSISTSEGRTYVSATANERGVAYNPFTGYAYIVSRNTALKVARVTGALGEDAGNLDVTGVSGGTFALNQIGVADDGNIYAANLHTGGASSTLYKIYRWPDEGSAPYTVFTGNPMTNGFNPRVGDTFDVRGSGINTEIIAAVNSTNLVFIFRPTDATLMTFTQSVILVTGAGLTDFAKGITFGPTNTFFGKNTGSGTLRLCSYNWVAGNGSGASLRTYTIDTRINGIDFDPNRNIIGGVLSPNAASPHAVMVYDLSSGSAGLLYSNAFPTPNAANVNAVGAINIFSNRMISVATVNGVQMTAIEDGAFAPSVSPLGSLTIVEGGYATLAPTITGTRPLTYQWHKNGGDLQHETNSTLVFTNVPTTAGGGYDVFVANYVGSANSSTATVTIASAVLSDVARTNWHIPPGTVTHPWIATDNNARGMAYNPANNTVIVCSRSGGNNLYVLDAETGAVLRQMSFNGSGGTFAINMVGCADDGRVFACNLTTGSTTDPFKIYMWPSDAAGVNPTVIYQGDPTAGTAGVRFGDNFDVQGGGISNPDLRILAASRNHKVAFLIRDAGFGTYNDLLLINTPDAVNGAFGLSVALAEENMFWGKANGLGFHMTKVSYDAVTGAGTVVKLITNANVAVVGYSLANQWIGGVSIEQPDNVRLYDVSGETAVALDTDHFPQDNPNANGTGSVKFGVNRMFVLESNNGLMGFKLRPLLRKSVSGNTMTLTWQGTYTLQASGEVTSGWTNVTTTSGYNFDISSSPQTFFRLLE